MLHRNIKLKNALIFNINQETIREIFTLNSKGFAVKITNVCYLDPPRWDFIMPPFLTDPSGNYTRYRITYYFLDEFGTHQDEIEVIDGDLVLFTGTKLVRLDRNKCNIYDTNDFVDVVFEI